MRPGLCSAEGSRPCRALRSDPLSALWGSMSGCTHCVAWVQECRAGPSPAAGFRGNAAPDGHQHPRGQVSPVSRTTSYLGSPQKDPETTPSRVSLAAWLHGCQVRSVLPAGTSRRRFGPGPGAPQAINGQPTESAVSPHEAGAWGTQPSGAVSAGCRAPLGSCNFGPWPRGTAAP